MPQIKEITVSYGRTVNLGNYESSRLDIEISADVLPDENIENVMDELRTIAKLKINQWIQIEEKKRHAEDYF